MSSQKIQLNWFLFELNKLRDGVKLDVETIGYLSNIESR